MVQNVHIWKNLPHVLHPNQRGGRARRGRFTHIFVSAPEMSFYRYIA
jgi:hypothetical protein